jgi:hypothetical protein
VPAGADEPREVVDDGLLAAAVVGQDVAQDRDVERALGEPGGLGPRLPDLAGQRSHRSASRSRARCAIHL